MKEQDKNHSKRANEMEIGKGPDEEFKVMAMKMLIGLEKRVNELSEN